MNRTHGEETALKGVAKIVRGSPKHVTRFHTERGTLMPLRAWIALPAVIGRRLRPARGSTPWFVPAAVKRLEGSIQPDWNVLEFGGGNSTIWFAERVGSIISLEDNREWYVRVVEELGARGLRNGEVRYQAAEEFVDIIRAFPDESLDLIVVDGPERHGDDRLACVDAASQKVKLGGYLLLDDSDRATYAPADRLLAGWSVDRFAGIKPFPLTATETSLYRRPVDDAHRAETR